MAKRLLWFILPAAALSGCSQAAAATVDPSDDIHCSVIAFYFKGHPSTQAAPQDARFAVERVFEWYAAKSRAIAAERGADYALRAAEPVLEAVKKDFLAHREHLVACTNRAVADPAFDAWLHSR